MSFKGPILGLNKILADSKMVNFQYSRLSFIKVLKFY